MFVYAEQEGDFFFFSDHKMNHEAAEEFHSLCACSSMCDLEDYWSQFGTATVLPPRGSDNKTQLLGKIIARRHQNISHHASILPALKDFYLPQSYQTLSEKKNAITRNRREEESSFPRLPLLLISLLSTISRLAAQARNPAVIPDFSPLPFLDLQVPTLS